MKKFFLDIDGVLLDFHLSYSRYLEKVIGIKFIKDEIEFHTHQNYVALTDTVRRKKDIFDKYIDNFMNSDDFSQLKSIVEEKSYQQLFKNYPIFLVTNIGTKYKKQRIDNLALRGISYSGLYFAGEEKYGEKNYPSKQEVIKKLVDTSDEIFFLDDLPINCQLIHDHIPQAKVFLLDKLYNRKANLKGCIRVKDWLEFIEYTK